MSKKRLWASVAVVLVLGGGAIGWKVYSGHVAFEEKVERIKLDFEVELGRDAPELGAFPARVMDVEGWEQEPTLLRILARIYLMRGQPEKARERLEPLIVVMTPEVEDAMLGGAACLMEHRVAGGEALLRRALGLFRAGDSAEALGRQWQCAVRLGDDAERKAIVGRLEAVASTPEARLARLYEAWVANEPVDEDQLIRVSNELEESGSLGADGALEAVLLDVGLRIQAASSNEEAAGELGAAERMLEPLLNVAPAVVPVRRLAALALCARLQRGERLTPSDLERLRGHLRWLLDQNQQIQGRDMFEKVLAAIGG